MIIFRYRYIKILQHIVNNIPEESDIGRSENGWMSQATFYEYIANSFEPFLNERALKNLRYCLWMDISTSCVTPIRKREMNTFLRLFKGTKENGKERGAIRLLLVIGNKE